MYSYIVLLLIISFTLMNNFSIAFGGRKILDKDYITLDVNSFLSTSCKAYVQGRSRPGSLEVMHKYGHCSKFGGRIEPPSLEEILERDKIRVSAIHNTRQAFKPEKSNNINDDVLGESKAAVIPAKSGVTIGSGNYVVSVGLGTPAKDVTLEFDTGSSLTWTQCKPCLECHQQKDPIFDPSASTSFTILSCNSAQCSHLNDTGGTRGFCSQQSDCIYGTGYGDKSSSSGFLGNEVLTLTPNDVFGNFTFGCGIDNDGTAGNLFGATAGLLGLGQDLLSVVSQTAGKYGKYFSYCLPTLSGSNGHLTFGKDNASPPGNLAFTPLVNDPKGQFYYVNIVAIKVKGTQIAISPSEFQSGGGTIIDSGTVITQLPTTVYAALRDAFKQEMSAYTLLAQADNNFDTCYDFSNQTNILFPKISFIFEGNVEVDIFPAGILIRKSMSVFCLAFTAGNIGIFGNLQQQTYDVAYDIAGGRLGFAPNGCP